MALGTILGAAAGGLASAGATSIASKLFGSSSSSGIGQGITGTAKRFPAPKVKKTKVDFSGAEDALTKTINQFKSGGIGATSLSSPGLGIDISKTGDVSLSRSGEVTGLLDTLRGAGDEAVSGITGLLDEVRPGFGKVTDARVQAVHNARDKAVGDLRDNLARRRVSGSSFASDTIARAEREFADAEAEARAQSFLEELDATKNLIDQRFAARTQVVETELAQTQFETGLGAQLLSQTRTELENSRKILADLGLARAQLRANEATLQADVDLKTRLANAELKAGSLRTGAGVGINASDQGRLTDTAAGATFGQVLNPAIKTIGSETSKFISGLAA